MTLGPTDTGLGVIVTMQGDEFEIDADAIAWTKRAVHISYMDRFGHPDTAWVWAGAVVRR
ncbi:hypothetical protein [Oerskovia sp. Root22]|uniref:hypothetical protein n=1 Tax=Oerskovia sp. Root22 TaxID=1736494 RepID=UPI000ADA626E|nr:hypothetical protein [Oerskovia sp. Root22]